VPGIFIFFGTEFKKLAMVEMRQGLLHPGCLVGHFRQKMAVSRH